MVPPPQKHGNLTPRSRRAPTAARARPGRAKVIIVPAGPYTLRCRARLTSNVRHRENQHAQAASQCHHRKESAGHIREHGRREWQEEPAASRSQFSRHASVRTVPGHWHRDSCKKRNCQTPNRKLHHRAPWPHWARPCGCLARCANQPSLLHRLLRSPCPRRFSAMRLAGTAAGRYFGGPFAPAVTAGEFHKGPAKRSLRAGGA
jgi:hypothetical protein